MIECLVITKAVQYQEVAHLSGSVISYRCRHLIAKQLGTKCIVFLGSPALESDHEIERDHEDVHKYHHVELLK